MMLAEMHLAQPMMVPKVTVTIRDIICTQGSVNSCRDLRICTAQRNLLFCKQTAENGELPIFSSVERRRTKCRAI